MRDTQIRGYCDACGKLLETHTVCNPDPMCVYDNCKSIASVKVTLSGKGAKDRKYWVCAKHAEKQRKENLKPAHVRHFLLRKRFEKGFIVLDEIRNEEARITRKQFIIRPMTSEESVSAGRYLLDIDPGYFCDTHKNSPRTLNAGLSMINKDK